MSLVVLIVAANNSSVREESASKIGSCAMFCFKTLIAVRPAMVASFAPATAIITRNNYTTTSEPNRPGGVYGKKRGSVQNCTDSRRHVTAVCQNENERSHARTSILRPLPYLWRRRQKELCAAFRYS